MNIQEAKDKFVDILRDDVSIKYWRNGERNQNMPQWYIDSSNLRTLYNLFDEIDMIEETFYAKIKGWDKVKCHDGSQSGLIYWNYNSINKELFVSSKPNLSDIQTIATIARWNELGIDQSNAVFEKA